VAIIGKSESETGVRNAAHSRATTRYGGIKDRAVDGENAMPDSGGDFEQRVSQ
jgi:hypothetical protein